ncbi:hypothetical protein BDV25DRAFT_140307 [Aspergillus avenaceus]|uniref:Uncharacterized protein n=1 Tax=Aspergillus avenaceus TaxID=36643 RepID=A0A5N6TUG4_ASPAV|nr:hypothetical protein BDV25DRAFT_140307 [Aspergillus avenaceus]
MTLHRPATEITPSVPTKGLCVVDLSAVACYTEARLAQLAQTKEYNSVTYGLVRDHIRAIKEDERFLCVAAVCNALEDAPPRRVTSIINGAPAKLKATYDDLWNTFQRLEDADDAVTCLRLLSLMVAARKPLRLNDLAAVAELTEVYVHNPEWLQELVWLCGSFLALRGDHVDFVHPSARKYLCQKVPSDNLTQTIAQRVSQVPQHGPVSYQR